MALSVAQYAQISNWFTVAGTGTARQVTGAAWSSGDRIIVFGGIADSGSDVVLGTPTNANLTFALDASVVGTPSECEAYVWSATAGSAQTAQTISSTQTMSGGSTAAGIAAWVVTGAPTGVANATANLNESAISRTVQAGSVVIYGLFDWNATNPPGKTPLAGGGGTTTERRDAGDGVNYGQYLYDEVGTAAGTFSFGPSNYTSLKVAQVIIEILPPAGTAPAAPSGLIGSPGDTTVVLDWTDGADGGSAVTDHDVDWALASAPTSWLGPVATGSTAVTYVKTSLTNGTAYVFRVRAVNAVGDGAWSASSGEITPAAEVPLIESRLVARPMGRMG